MARAPRTSKEVTDEPPSTPERLKRVRTPELEIAIGARIRAARIAAGLSQSAVGEALGISWQQVQKYEKGLDRVAASTLQRIAETLKIHPGSFFDADMPAPVGRIPNVKTVVKIGQRIQRVRNPTVMRRLLALADLLAEDENEQAAVTGDGTL